MRCLPSLAKNYDKRANVSFCVYVVFIKQTVVYKGLRYLPYWFIFVIAK